MSLKIGDVVMYVGSSGALPYRLRSKPAVVCQLTGYPVYPYRIRWDHLMSQSFAPVLVKESEIKKCRQS